MTTTTTQLSKSGQQGRVHYTNRDLPPGSQDANVWHRVFIPTYIVFVANYSDPWSVKDEDALVALQHVWNTVYLNPKKTLALLTQLNTRTVCSRLYMTCMSLCLVLTLSSG
jgi:hypothetical protein